MRHGWRVFSLCAALALMGAIAVPTAQAAASKSETAEKRSTQGSKAKSQESLRQFTGVVVAVDTGSITVEKGGKQPKTVVFEKHPEMRTQGKVDEGARVTVYYRGTGKRVVAHRVVAKPAAGSKRGR